MSGEIPQKLGKYEVVRELARGSMGVVYEGYDPYIDRPVALKVALAESLTDGDAGQRYRKMFFNEAHTAGMLQHANILDIFDAGVDDDVCYIVMELIEGGDTLKNYCKPERLLPVTQAVELIYKCAKALDYAHRQGVIHRDIKPTNILLTPDLDVKIADFSIAHIAHADLSNTMPMGFVGSPRYMSPEQIQEDVLTSQTDIYSLGVVFYELLTGRHPFAAETFSKLIYNVINEPVPPLSKFRSDLPDALNRILARALEKDPNQRYRTGLDMAIDLSVAFTHLERPQGELSSKQKFSQVKKLDFFRGFPDSEIWEIIRAAVWREADVDELLIREGQVEDWFYIVTAGTVRIEKGGQAVGKLKAGDCFGEMGYLSKSRRTASAIADGPVTIMKINSTLIEQVTQECQLRFYKVFVRVLCDRLSKTTELAVQA
jgi:serine/threonine protein kinase